MILYVIRHGETAWNKVRRLQGQTDIPLNENGISQAKKRGEDLRKLDIHIIYCSPIERAKHTLELFNLDKNIPVIIDERIKERNMGIYENIPFKNLDWDIF